MSTLKYPSGININPNQGGKAAIERLMKAYGFATRQALADHLGVSKSTLANRYMRDTFPSDWIIKCALESGVSLLWLTTAEGPMFLDAKNEIISLSKELIIDGKLSDSGYFLFDLNFLPNIGKNISSIKDRNVTYIIERSYSEISDGLWVISIDDYVSIRDIIRLPKNRVALDANSRKIECNLDEIKVIAKVIMTCK